MSARGKFAGLVGLAALAATAGGIGIAGAVVPATAAPTVSSISITGYPLPATPTITVNGSNFGSTAPTNGVSPVTLTDCGSGTGFDYPKGELWLLDGSRSGGLSGAFQEGEYFGHHEGNCGGIVISSWTASEIKFTLGSRYATDGHSLQAGDTVCIDVKEVPACTVLS